MADGKKSLSEILGSAQPTRPSLSEIFSRPPAQQEDEKNDANLQFVDPGDLTHSVMERQQAAALQSGAGPQYTKEQINSGKRREAEGLIGMAGLGKGLHAGLLTATEGPVILNSGEAMKVPSMLSKGLEATGAKGALKAAIKNSPEIAKVLGLGGGGLYALKKALGL